MEIAPGFSQFGNLSVYAFPASQLGIYGQQAGGPSRFLPIPADQVLEASGADAALDGTQWDNCPGNDFQGDSVRNAQSTCAYPVFMAFDADSGVNAPSLRPGDGLTISVAGGQASALPGAQAAPGATVAMQLFPGLVSAGAVIADNSGSNANSMWRAALAIMSPTQLAFVVGTGTMVDFANAILQMGATDAGYTDGSYSAALATSGGVSGPTPYRHVPLWLVARSNVARAAGSALAAFVTAAGLAVAYYFWRKSKV